MTFRASSPGNGTGGGTVSSVTGTANQVTASPTSGAITLSLPATIVAPGSVAATTQFLAADGTAAAPGYAFTSGPDTGVYVSNAALHSVMLKGGTASATSNGGSAGVNGGAGGATSGNGGPGAVQGGIPIDGDGGPVIITARAGVGTNRNGGSVTITAGAATGSGTPGKISFVGGQRVTVRVVTAAGAVTVTGADYVVVVNKTVGAATTVNLPASPTAGDAYIIKDGKGDAAANNITVTPAAGTIDGAATAPITTNYGSLTLAYNGTQWNVI